MEDPRKEIGRILREENDFLVASHENPDGDALGSIAAMGFILKALGKRFQLYNASGVPERFGWLELPGPVLTSPKKVNKFSPNRYLVLDCGALHRVGTGLEAVMDLTRTVNIDHHLANPMFGAVNWVDPAQAAVGEMVGALARDLDIPMHGGLGEALYLALVTDSGHFSYGSTRPGTMEMAAEILRQGLNPAEFTDKLDNCWPERKLRLWLAVLDKVRYHRDASIAVLKVPESLLVEVGAVIDDCDGLINFIRRIDTVRVAVILRDSAKHEGMVKFSMRSKGVANVQEVAAFFGGGGHRNAAGGFIEGPMDRAEGSLLDALDRLLKLGEA
jgi:bifunctional oligoribonuclease and PAP phosphatase NrnA